MMVVYRLFILVVVVLLALSGCSEGADSRVPESGESPAEPVIAPAEDDPLPSADSTAETNEDADDETAPAAEPAPAVVALPDGVSEYTTRNGATLLETTVSLGPLNVRDQPGLSGEVVAQLPEGSPVIVIGLSERVDVIDDHEGRWLHITDPDDRNWVVDPLGWVFSRYVTGAESLPPRDMRVVGLTEPESGSTPRLNLTLDGVQQSVSQDRHETQDFHIFQWTADQRGFSYRDIPGAYAWREGQEEAELIMHYQGDAESAWVAFTDDFTYMIEDFGTGPGVRGLSVTNVETGEHVFGGAYYRDINLDGYTIEVVERYTGGGGGDDRNGQQTNPQVEAFLEDNPEPADNPHGLPTLLLVKYRLNIESGQREFIGAEWILTQ